LSRTRTSLPIRFGFFRRAHIAPGLSINLSRFGPSLSGGVRGAHITIGRRGITRTVGLPGTGVFYTSRIGLYSGYHSAADRAPFATRRQQRASDRHVESVIALVLFVFAVGFVLLLNP
jgi:hypothetical protein